ncbi:MAG: hypothetical protein JSW65_04215 [Candidatus Bipolaricaulota bacterium]|nr:MAG: hypothetical protein JSW65_04215 [Candidatus Bipolaricaulota bacterium]
MSDQKVLRVSAEEGQCGERSRFHTQVIRAASRLEAQWPTWEAVPPRAAVDVVVAPGCDPSLGDEGYAIRSESDARIRIEANSDAGAANGVYGLLMEARHRHCRNPFATSWAITETPYWQDRRASLASYAMGMSKMTPETWTFEDWKEYIDFARSLNVNRLSILGVFPYHPDVPESYKGRWRMVEQARAIGYAHEHGMKVNVMTAYNHVPTQVFWDHPELRTEAVRGYFGLALCWSKAKDLIMKFHRQSFEALEGLDGIEVMVTEPLGWCLCDQCRPDTAAVWLDAVRELGSALKERNPDAEVVFWNWLSGFFTALRGIYPPTTEIKNLDRIQDQLLDGMPEGTVFTDLSVNQMETDVEFGPRLSHHDSIEILAEAPKRGFESRNFLFFMDKEFGMLDRLSLFPKPFLDYTLSEIAYTKALPVAGVSTCRLAPPGRFLSDYFSMRLAWNPDLGRQELLDGAAAYLTKSAEEGEAIAEAIGRLEAYWHHRKRDDLLLARDAFDAAAGPEAYPELVRIRDGLTILAMIDDFAATAKAFEEAIEGDDNAVEAKGRRDVKLLEVYEALKAYPIYQGLTTDGLWEPRSIVMHLRPRMEMWAQRINHSEYYH